MTNLIMSRTLSLSRSTPSRKQPCALQEVMTNLMVSHLAFKAEEDPDVAQYAFKKDITIQVGLEP